jgi:ATP-binding cassette subfamily B protein
VVRLARESLALVAAAAPLSFATTSALQLLAAAASAVALLLGRDALDAVLAADRNGGDLGTLLRVAAPVLVLVAFRRVAEAVVATESMFLADQVGRAANDRILDVTTAVDMEAFEDPAFLDQLERALAGAGRPMEIVRGLLNLIGNGMGMIALVWAVSTLQPLLLPLLAVGTVPLWLAASRNSGDTFRTDLELVRSRRLRTYLRSVLVSREAAAEVRSFGLGGVIRQRYDQEYDRWMDARRRLQRRLLRRTLRAASVGSVLTIGFGGVLATLFLDARLSLSAAVVAVFGARQLRHRIEGVLTGVAGLYEAALFLDGMQAFVDRLPQIEAARPTAVVSEPFRRLVVEDVSFTYPGTDRAVLRNVSMEIEAGQVIALVGANGSGKTTLAKLLCQLYRPQSGRILWDGVDTATVDPRSTRASIGVVLQDFVRYQLDGWTNIALGRPGDEDDREAMVAASCAAGADELLADLGHGYDTVLSRAFTDGEDLSTGQWQRVALARAFYRNAAFLVLDEPTAALDARAERDLFEGVGRLLRGRSVLLISHRLSSVRSADRIYVLDRGAIVEEGRHDHLMAAGGLYSELFHLQDATSGGDRAPLRGHPIGTGPGGAGPS